MHVFNAVLDGEFAAFGLDIDVFQCSQKHAEFVGRQQANAFKHRDVGHRTHDVILGQIEVQFAVTPDRKTLYLFVYLKIFLPEFHNKMMNDG